MKIKLIDRYIFSQVLWACLGCIIVFMIVWIMPEILLKIVQKTLSGHYTVETAIAVFFNELPRVLNIAIPVGMLLGTLMTFEKLSKDFEITVLRGVGFSFSRIIASVLVLSIFSCCFTFYVGAKLLPYSANNMKVIKGKEDVEVSQFVFPVKKAGGTPEKIIIVSNFSKKYIKDVIVLNFYPDSDKGSSILSNILVSDYVKFDNHKWTINRGKEYEIEENGVFTEINDVQNIDILENKKAEDAFKLMQYSLYRDRELNNTQMEEYINLLKTEQMDDEYNYMLNKYIQRYVHSIMCILFAILGCLLGFSRPREQKYIGMLGAVGVIFGYYITMPFFDMLAEKSLLNPVATALIAPVCIIIVIFTVKKAKSL